MKNKKEHKAFDLVDAIHDASETGDWDNAVNVMHEMSQESADSIRDRVDEKVKAQSRTFTVSREIQAKMPTETETYIQMNPFKLAWREFKRMFKENN